MTRETRDAWARKLFPGRLAGLHRLLQVLITFHLVLFAWVFFRAQSLEEAYSLILQILTSTHLNDPGVLAPMGPVSLAAGLFGILALESAHLLQRRCNLSERVFALPLPLRWTVYFALIFTIIALGSFEAEQFIYFRF